MAGTPQISHNTASTARSLQLNMHSAALEGESHQWTQRHLRLKRWRKYATMSALNLTFNQSPESSCTTEQPTEKKAPASMWFATTFVEEIASKPTSTSRVFNPFAQTHRTLTLSQCHKRQEWEKRRTYEECFLEIEHGSFTTRFQHLWRHGANNNDSLQETCSTHLRETNQQYSTTLHWMRCRLSLSLIRSAIMCLREARSAYHCPTFSGDTMDVISVHDYTYCFL